MPDDEDVALTVYRALRARGGFSSAADLRSATGLDADRARRGTARLLRLGLARETDGTVEPVDPDAAAAQALDSYTGVAVEQLRQASALQDVLRSLTSVYRLAVDATAGSPVEVDYVTDKRRKEQSISDNEALCHTRTDSMHPGPMPPMRVLEQSLAGDLALIARGVRVRAIYPQWLPRSPRYLGYLRRLAAGGAEVRLIDHCPCDMVIHDQRSASLPAEPANPRAAMLVVRGAALVAVVSAIYEDYWLRAVPFEHLPADPPTEAREPTAQERLMVQLMAEGLSDEQIARRMGVHRRTVQRAVAKLLDRLHATSRFEAGLKLAQDPGLARAVRAPHGEGPVRGDSPARAENSLRGPSPVRGSSPVRAKGPVQDSRPVQGGGPALGERP